MTTNIVLTICMLVIVACNFVIWLQTRKLKKLAEENLERAKENLRAVYAKYGIDKQVP